jgi:hypothetical protein
VKSSSTERRHCKLLIRSCWLICLIRPEYDSSREAASTSFFLFFSITNIIKQRILAGNLHAGSQPGIEKIWSWQSLMIATWWLSHHNLMQL